MKNEKVMLYKVIHRTIFSAPGELPEIIEIPATKSAKCYNFESSSLTGYVSRVEHERIGTLGFALSREGAMKNYKVSLQEKMNSQLAQLKRLQVRLDVFEIFEQMEARSHE